MKYTTSNQKHCQIKNSDCRKIIAKDGLAALSSDDAIVTIKTALSQQIQKDEKQRIVKITLLGKGGFRRLSIADQNRRLKEIMNAIFESTPYTATGKVLTGEEEAELAWQSVAANTGSSTHTIIETGGASMQVAVGQNGVVQRKMSLPLGMNDVRAKLGETSSCFSKPTADRFDLCRSEIEPLLGRLSSVSIDNATVFGLGSPYSAIMAQLHTNTVSLSLIDRRGKEACAAGQDQLTKWQIEESNQPLTCFLYAYHSVQLSKLNVSQITKADGSWPTGAALSADYFAGCQ